MSQTKSAEADYRMLRLCSVQAASAAQAPSRMTTEESTAGMAAEESDDIFLAVLHASSIANAKNNVKTKAGMNLCINTSFVYEETVVISQWLVVSG